MKRFPFIPYLPFFLFSLLFSCSLSDDYLESNTTVQGQLEEEDDYFDDASLFDTYYYEGIEGEEIRIMVESEEFDTYLVLYNEAGEMKDNDDGTGMDTNSSLLYAFSSDETVEILVTSYEPETTGSYTLKVESEESLSSSGEDIGEASPDDSVITGELAPGDTDLETGEYYDTYTVSGTEGQYLNIVLASGDFDTYLMVEGPGDYWEEIDDSEGTSNSSFEKILDVSGDYYLYVTSYSPEETGSYTLAYGVDDTPDTFEYDHYIGYQGEGDSSEPIEREESENRSFFDDSPTSYYGIFVGISDYPASDNDLEYCREDAQNLAAIFRETGIMPSSSQVELVDSAATGAAFRQAVEGFSAQMDANDTLFFFYSGHGDSMGNTSSASQERDSHDESLVFYDEDLLDNQLAELLESVPGKVALVFDACFAAGFAKDVITRPGWYGIFSSEEDIESLVADEFQAGGYLSYYLLTALQGEADGATGDRKNNIITIGELERFLHTRYYDSETGVPADSNQHLVFDRNGVDINEELFALR